MDTKSTMVARPAERYPGREGVVAADGVHDRLQQTGAAYLAQR